jgi:hypothetical protein
MNSFYKNGRMHQIPQASAGNTRTNGKDGYPTMLKLYLVPSLDELPLTLALTRIQLHANAATQISQVDK